MGICAYERSKEATPDTEKFERQLADGSVVTVEKVTASNDRPTKNMEGSSGSLSPKPLIPPLSLGMLTGGKSPPASSPPAQTSSGEPGSPGSNYTDYVRIRLFYALNLLNKPKQGSGSGVSRTYIRFQLNGKELKSSTATTNITDAEQDPIWDETLGVLPVVDLNSDKIIISAFDEVTGLIGERDLPLSHQMLKLDDGLEKEVNVPFKRQNNTKTGEVAFSVQYAGKQLSPESARRSKSSTDLVSGAQTAEAAYDGANSGAVDIDSARRPANEPNAWIKIFLETAEVTQPKGKVNGLSAKFSVERKNEQYGDSLKSDKLSSTDRPQWNATLDGALKVPVRDLQTQSADLVLRVQLYYKRNIISKALLGETYVSLAPLAGIAENDPRSVTANLTLDDHKSGGYLQTGTLHFRYYVLYSAPK